MRFSRICWLIVESFPSLCCLSRVSADMWIAGLYPGACVPWLAGLGLHYLTAAAAKSEHPPPAKQPCQVKTSLAAVAVWQCRVHCVLCRVQKAASSVLWTLFSVHCSVHCAVYSAVCIKLCTVKCALCCVQCIVLCTVQCVVQWLHTMVSLHRAKHIITYNCEQYFVQSKL